jgi:hypothetical protein
MAQEINMLFLIEYDRLQGQVVSFRSFKASDASIAQDARLLLELDLNRQGIKREIVVLEAADEDALRRTHRRYFGNLQELAEPLG